MNTSKMFIQEEKKETFQQEYMYVEILDFPNKEPEPEKEEERVAILQIL